MDRLRGMVAVVTGGGSGLATARRFLAEGAEVAIGDRSAAPRAVGARRGAGTAAAWQRG